MTLAVDFLGRVIDRWDPPDPHTFERLGYTPNCRIVAQAAAIGQRAEPCGTCPQEVLHQIEAFSLGGPFDVLYGGAAFGGKSWGLLMDTLDDCMRYPGLEVWWVREDYPQLRDSVLTDLERLDWCQTQLGCRWNGGKYTLTFPNGSLFKFRHARNLADATQMLSASCQKLVLDERTTLDPDVVQKLSTRVRSGRPGVPVIGVRSGTNPGGKGHSTVKQEFVDPAPLGHQRIPAKDPTGDTIHTSDGRTLDRLFLPARMEDNPAGIEADPTYEARFSMFSAELAAAYRDGDWSKFEGMRFSRFDPRRHIVPAGQIDIPLGGVRRGLGIDWGSAAPFCAAWSVLLNEQLIFYRELHEPGLTPTEQAEQILAAEAVGERLQQRPIATWIDPATWARSPEKPLAKPISPDAPPPGSIAHRYRQAGVPVEKAYNDRISGWSLLDELLGDLPDGRPQMVFSDACPNLIRSFTGAPRDPRNPEDVDAGYKDDHGADTVRYNACGMMRRANTGRRRGSGGSAGISGTTSGLARSRS